MTLAIDTLAYTNRLRNLFPLHKLVFALSVLALALITHSWLQLLIFLWMSIWIVVYAKIPSFIYLKMVLLALLFWAGSLPALVINGVLGADVAIISPDVIKGMSFGPYYLYLSHKGFETALVILARSMATISCLYFLMFTVPLVEVLETLQTLGFPKLLTELMLLIYRFIFIFLAVVSEILIAQKSRNGYHNLPASFRSLSMLIAQLLNRTIQHYHQFSDGLNARGYNGELKFWRSPRYHISQRYALEAFFGYSFLTFLTLK